MWGCSRCCCRGVGRGGERAQLCGQGVVIDGDSQRICDSMEDEGKRDGWHSLGTNGGRERKRGDQDVDSQMFYCVETGFSAEDRSGQARAG